jgi:hypothetical protein
MAPEPEGLPPYSQKPATGPYPQPAGSTPPDRLPRTTTFDTSRPTVEGFCSITKEFVTWLGPLIKISELETKDSLQI